MHNGYCCRGRVAMLVYVDVEVDKIKPEYIFFYRAKHPTVDLTIKSLFCFIDYYHFILLCIQNNTHTPF